MTEAQWLALEDPARMLEWLAVPHVHRPEPVRSFVTDRKLRLFAAACCRAVWPLLTDPRSRRAIDAGEEIADGLRLIEANHLVADAYRAIADAAAQNAAILAHGVVCTHEVLEDALRGHVSAPHQAALLRCIFGNPWKPVRLQPACVRCGCAEYEPEVEYAACARCAGDMRPPSWLAWNDGAVGKMAAAIYDSRRFADLPLLCDALEESGCCDAEILAHGRGPGPHARGCWVVDLLLGKE
jgi:hypothetical protein